MCAFGSVGLCAVLACLPARVATAPPPFGHPLCAGARADTTGWVLTRNHELGVEFLRPPSYLHKVWESRHGMGNVVDWWRDDRPRYTFNIDVVDSLTARWHPEFLSQLEDVRWCSLEGPAGVAEALLYRSGSATYGGQQVVPYQLAIRWPTREGRVIRFGASSADSAGRDEQLAIARTMRTISSPQRR